MESLRVLVLNGADHPTAALVARLRKLGVPFIEVISASEGSESYGPLPPADLLLCESNLGDRRFVEILRRSAASPHPPAVVVHGVLADLAAAESLCQRLGLRYLGQFTDPIPEERLRRTVRTLRRHRAAEGDR